jgi:hypothetical protein
LKICTFVLLCFGSLVSLFYVQDQTTSFDVIDASLVDRDNGHIVATEKPRYYVMTEDIPLLPSEFLSQLKEIQFLTTDGTLRSSAIQGTHSLSCGVMKP